MKVVLTAKNMFIEGFEVSVIKKVTKLTDEELEQIEKRFLLVLWHSKI